MIRVFDGNVRNCGRGSSVTGGPKFALKVAMLACLNFLFARCGVKLQAVKSSG